MKVTFKEWIMLFMMVGIFVAITAYLITFFFDISGPVVTTVALVIIFFIFKLYQYNKDDGEKTDYMGEEERID